MIAAMTTGPIADRWGRKWPVIFSTLSFAVFSLDHRARHFVPRAAHSSIPHRASASAERCPTSSRSRRNSFRGAFFRTWSRCFSSACRLGGVTCGLLSAVMIPRWGWQSVLYLGGTIPLVIAILLIAGLPESIQFLAVRGKSPQKVARILTRIAPEFAASEFARHSARHAARRRARHPSLHRGPRLRHDPALDSLLHEPADHLFHRQLAARVVAPIRHVRLGGSDRDGFLQLWRRVWLSLRRLAHQASWRLLFCSPNSASRLLFITALSKIPSSSALMLAVTFISGFMIIGAQAGLNALAANLLSYRRPFDGIGWALGVGRIGSIVGPLLGGCLLEAGWTPGQILLSGTVCGGLRLRRDFSQPDRRAHERIQLPASRAIVH